MGGNSEPIKPLQNMVIILDIIYDM